MRPNIKWDTSRTEEELRELLKTDRVRKTKQYRVPKEGVQKTKAVFKVARETGFTIADVRVVLNAYHKLITDTLEENKHFKIGNIGTLYRELRPPTGYTVGGFTGKTRTVIHPPHYRLEFIPTIPLIKKYKQEYVSDEELKNAYFTEEELKHREVMAERRLKKSKEYWDKKKAENEKNRKNNI